ncbi:glycosyltransferase [uncultured Bacteroides sp.]|uniref:glycosyltransferase n=1 Tax=uncultured Bacteroides sp. TaxID=162156 RepID=UPI002674D655|nr:glycosyltransferase [uncultured Bacteroides sp.]
MKMYTDNVILNIGPCSFRYDKDKTGGIVVLFEQWLTYCREIGINTIIVDTNKHNYSNRIMAYLNILWQILTTFSKVDILFLHGTLNDYLLIAPFVVCLSKCTKKRVAIRKFAGNFEQYYFTCGRIKRFILNYVLKNANVVFWETKSLVRFGEKLNPDTYWFPNVRQATNIRRGARPYEKRFCFLSRVEEMKGVDILMTCFSNLDTNYQLDIYGPVIGYSLEDLEGKNYKYKGMVEPQNVCRVLAQYDVLILPTLWKAEGYPGVIIEAFSVGIPVISTKMGAIPELIKQGVNGFLVEAGETESLKDAILQISQDTYFKLHEGALSSFNLFDANQVNNHIVKLL